MVAGTALVVLFAILPISAYPVFSYPYHLQQGADYTPFLKLQILGLRESYIAGEGVDFAVEQRAGGACVFPEHIMIKDLDTGRIIKEWDGATESAILLGCPIDANPLTSGMTWTTKSWEKPLIFNQTGSYAVVAKHLFKMVQKDFKVVAVGDDGSDTSSQVAMSLLSKSSNLDTVKVLLHKYPDANTTLTANYRSKLFEEFQKYHPSGIVQYQVVKSAATEYGKEGRSLTVTVIFDRYYENNSVPLVLVQCVGENYNSLSSGESYVEPSKIENC